LNESCESGNKRLGSKDVKVLQQNGADMRTTALIGVALFLLHCSDAAQVTPPAPTPTATVQIDDLREPEWQQMLSARVDVDPKDRDPEGLWISEDPAAGPQKDLTAYAVRIKLRGSKLYVAARCGATRAIGFEVPISISDISGDPLTNYKALRILQDAKVEKTYSGQKCQLVIAAGDREMSLTTNKLLLRESRSPRAQPLLEFTAVAATLDPVSLKPYQFAKIGRP
jgi:hypothetical protein